MNDLDFSSLKSPPPQRRSNSAPLVVVLMVLLIGGGAAAMWLVVREVQATSVTSGTQPGAGLRQTNATLTTRTTQTTRPAPTQPTKPVVDSVAEDRKRQAREVEEKRRKYQERTDRFLASKIGMTQSLLRNIRDKIITEDLDVSQLSPDEILLLKAYAIDLLNEYLADRIIAATGSEGEAFFASLRIAEKNSRAVRFAYWFYDGDDKQILNEIADACRKHGGYSRIPEGFMQQLQRRQFALMRDAMFN